MRLTLDPQPWLRSQATIYTASEMYHFKPLNERVTVFMKSFRLRRDLTLQATPESQKLLAALSTVTIRGALDCEIRLSSVVEFKGL